MVGNLRIGENFRESWFATNLTSNVVSIGDLPLIPTFDPGQSHDLLHFYSKEKINHSKNLSFLVKRGLFRLEKQKVGEAKKDVSAFVDKAISIAEEDEVTGGGASVIDDLSDVNTLGVVDGQILEFDDADNTWKPTSAGSGTVTQTEKDNLELEFRLEISDITRFIENTYTGSQLTAIDIWEDNAKIVKLFNVSLSYSGKQLSSMVITRISDSATLTKTFSYTGNRLDSIDIT